MHVHVHNCQVVSEANDHTGWALNLANINVCMCIVCMCMHTCMCVCVCVCVHASGFLIRNGKWADLAHGIS